MSSAFKATPAPGPYFRVCSRIGLFGIAQGRLQVAMPQTLSDRGKTHPVVDEFGGMGVPELVKCAFDIHPLTVTGPPFLHRLIAQRAAPTILLGPKQRSIAISHLLEIGAKLAQKPGIVEQYRPLFSAFAREGKPFIVRGQVEILDMHAECFADPQSGFEHEPKEQPVAQLACIDDAEDTLNALAANAAREGYLTPYPFDPVHGIGAQ